MSLALEWGRPALLYIIPLYFMQSWASCTSEKVVERLPEGFSGTQLRALRFLINPLTATHLFTIIALIVINVETESMHPAAPKALESAPSIASLVVTRTARELAEASIAPNTRAAYRERPSTIR